MCVGINQCWSNIGNSTFIIKNSIQSVRDINLIKNPELKKSVGGEWDNPLLLTLIIYICRLDKRYFSELADWQVLSDFSLVWNRN